MGHLGIKESDTGLAHPGLWDLQADKQMMNEEVIFFCRSLVKYFFKYAFLSFFFKKKKHFFFQHPLQVARCTKIITAAGEADEKAKFIFILFIYLFRQMDGWMDGYIDGWMDG